MKIVLHYKPGELEFKLKAQANDNHLYYVGDDSEYQSQDIDFIANGKTTIEVKWDYWIHKTNNLFIETANPRSQNGLGWYKFCRADYLAYGDSKINVFHMIKMDDLRNYINKQTNLQEITTSDGAKGFLISLNDIADISRTF